MSKCVIFTLHGANNIGAFLQAYSLMTVIKRLGVDHVAFATYPSRSSSERSNLLDKVMRYVKAGDIRKLLYKTRTASMYRTMQASFLTLDMSTPPSVDYAVIGSDEVWNIKSDNFVHYPSYLGHEINAPKIIAYAPCGNGVTADDFRRMMPNEHFEAFTALSARDKDTQRCAAAVSGKDVTRVVDPTMLIDDFGIDYSSCPEKKDFMLVYSYGIDKKYIYEIRSFAKKNNLMLVSVGTYNSWCEKNVIANPWEFLGYLKAAKYVVASTFHGTILSIKFNKQFVCYAGNSSKVNDVLDFYHLERRNINRSGELEQTFDKPIDYVPVEKIIKESREKSMCYLKNAMEL